MEDSTIVHAHIPCEDCGSSDGKCVYSDGHTFCFVCDTRHHGDGEPSNYMGRKIVNKDLIPMSSLVLSALRARGITKETCAKYGYYIGDYRGQKVQVACVFNSAGEVIGQKVRTKDKNFLSFGEVAGQLIGQHLFPGGGKKVVVTEGEIDMLTVAQIQGNKYPVVSLPLGANSAKKTFKAQVEWLDQYEEVITMFDMDEAGEKARKDVEGILRPGKLKHASLQLKDANDCLLNDKADEVVRAIWNVKTYKPDGIINGADMKEKIKTKKATQLKGLPYPWQNITLQEMTKGIRMGEMLLLTAGTGIGKSTVARHIAYHFGNCLDEPIKIGSIFLEEDTTDTGLDFMSLHAKRRLHLEWDDITDEEYNRYFEETLGNGNYVFYDHFGSIDGESLLSKIRYMITAEGCKFIILDHISIAISGLDSGNERKDIDILMTNLRSLIQETGVGILVICHLKKTEGGKKSFEQGSQISVDDLRGSGTLKQIPNTIIAFERDQQAEDETARNIIRIRLLKCRFTGKTGLAGYLRFNETTGCLEVVMFEEENPFKDEEGEF